MSGRENDQLKEFVSSAAQRFTSVQLTVGQEVNLSAYRAALESMPANPSATAVLSSPMFGQAGVWSSWNVWLSRPYRYKVDHYDAPGKLADTAGGDEESYWQAFPADRWYHVSESQPMAAADDSSAPYFHTWLPPAVAQMLDPGLIWVMPEGYARDPVIRPLAERDFLGRRAIVAEVEIADWATRGAGWSEILLAADRYELVVDHSTGVLLEATSSFESSTVSHCSVASLFIDGSISAGFFKADRWTDKSWRSA